MDNKQGHNYRFRGGSPPLLRLYIVLAIIVLVFVGNAYMKANAPAQDSVRGFEMYALLSVSRMYPEASPDNFSCYIHEKPNEPGFLTIIEGQVFNCVYTEENKSGSSEEVVEHPIVIEVTDVYTPLRSRYSISGAKSRYTIEARDAHESFPRTEFDLEDR